MAPDDADATRTFKGTTVSALPVQQPTAVIE